MKQLKQNLNQNKYKLAIWIIMLVALALRLYKIDLADAWRDEAFSLNALNRGFWEMIRISVNDTQPPLHLVVIYFWTKIFGATVLSVRIVSVIFGMLTLYWGLKISQLIFKDKHTHIITLILLSLNPLLVYYSQEARTYTMLTAFTGAVIYYFLKLNDKTSHKDTALTILYSVLGLYAHNLFLLVLGPLFIFKTYILFSENKFKLKSLLKNKTFRSLLIIGASTFVFYIPWFIAFIGQLSKVSNEGFWLTFDPWHDFVIQNYRFFLGNNVWSTKEVLSNNIYTLIILIAFPLTVLGMWQEKKLSKYPSITIIFCLMLIFTFVLSFKTPFYYSRYMIFVIPPLMLILANGFSGLEKLSRKLMILILLLFIAANLIHLNNKIFINGKPHYRESISYLSQNYDSNSDIILHPHAVTFHSFNYYSDLPNYISDPERTNAFFEGLAIIQEQDYYDGELDNYQRIWTYNLWMDQTFETKLQKMGFNKQETHDFSNGLFVELWASSESPKTK